MAVCCTYIFHCFQQKPYTKMCLLTIGEFSHFGKILKNTVQCNFTNTYQATHAYNKQSERHTHISNTNRSTSNSARGYINQKLATFDKTNCRRVFTPSALFHKTKEQNKPSPMQVQKAIRSYFYSFRPNGQIVTFKGGWYEYLLWFNGLLAMGA